MDAVYTYKQTTSDELEWSVKSLKNISHGEVYVIGDDPNVDGVIHIEPDRQRWGKYSKYHDQMQNYLTACNDWKISDDFIAMMDDVFLLKPWDYVNYNRGTLDEHAKQRRLNDRYTQSLHLTGMYLEARHLPDLSFELHTPFVFNKERLKRLIDDLNPSIRSTYQIRSLYGNTYRVPTEYHEDVKNTTSHGLVSTDNKTWRGDVGEYVREQLA